MSLGGGSAARRQARAARQAADAAFRIASRQLDLAEMVARHYRLCFEQNECDYALEAFTTPAYIERPLTLQGRHRADVVQQLTAQWVGFNRTRNKYALGRVQEYAYLMASQMVFAYNNTFELAARVEHQKRDAYDDMVWARKHAAVRLGRNLIAGTASQLTQAEAAQFAVAKLAGEGYAATMAAVGQATGRLLEGIKLIATNWPTTQKAAPIEERSTYLPGEQPLLPRAVTTPGVLDNIVGRPIETATLPIESAVSTWPYDISVPQGVPQPPTTIR